MTATSTAQAQLDDARAVFLDAYQARPTLVAQQAGWSVTIALRATDTGAAAAVRFEDGRPQPLTQSADGPDLVVSADQRTLEAVLRLRLDPNEPYLFGELTVQGAEADFVRLDYIASQMCPL
jgi:hypothetical protein